MFLGYIVMFFLAVFALNAVANALASILPYAIGAGAFAAVIYFTIRSDHFKVWIREKRASKLERQISDAKERELRAEDATKHLNPEERRLARDRSSAETTELENQFEEVCSEIVKILRKRRERLRVEREGKIAEAGKSRSTEKFTRDIANLDATIQKTSFGISRWEVYAPKERVEQADADKPNPAAS